MIGKIFPQGNRTFGSRANVAPWKGPDPSFNPTLNSRDRQALQSLAKEKDPEMFLEGLLQLGNQVSGRHNIPALAAIHRVISTTALALPQEKLGLTSAVAAISERAQAQWDALHGRGPTGLRMEIFLGRFAEEALDQRTLLAWVGAGAALRLARMTTLAKLVANLSRNLLSRGWGARATSAWVAFLAEGATFTLASRLLRREKNIRTSEIPDLFFSDLGSTYSLLGVMRLTGSLVTFFKGKELLRQGGMLGGIYLGHELEEWLGGKNYERRTLVDSLALLLQFNVSAHLLQGLGGRSWGPAERKPPFADLIWRPQRNPYGKVHTELATLEIPFSRQASVRETVNKGGNTILMVDQGEGGGKKSGGRPSLPKKKDSTEIVPRKKDPEDSFQLPLSEPDPFTGKTIGNYQVLTRIGEGSVGIVYLGIHRTLGKKVAIKVLQMNWLDNAVVVRRFTAEGKAATAVGNPHIIEAIDTGILPNGSPYLVMEYLEGVALSQILEGGKSLPIPQILHLAKQLAQGLSAVHRSGIVHRDLKPGNIFLTRDGSGEDFVKILDFGIAHVPLGGEKITRQGVFLGTPQYASPEQSLGQAVDHRSDIYSLGMIFYEMASGRLPFEAGDIQSMLIKQATVEPMPLSSVVPSLQYLPPGFEALVHKCLAKQAARRYQTMEELLAGLEELGRVPDVPEGKPEPKRRGPWGLGLGAGAALTLAASLWATIRWLDQSDVSKDTLPSPTTEPTLESEGTILESPLPKFPRKKQVNLTITPAHARIFLGPKDLGPQRIFELEGEKRLDLEIRCPGYKTEKISLDGENSEIIIRLDPVSPRALKKPRATPLKTTPPPIGKKVKEPFDPWK